VRGNVDNRNTMAELPLDVGPIHVYLVFKDKAWCPLEWRRWGPRGGGDLPCGADEGGRIKNSSNMSTTFENNL
jgi:hypothetical protein